MINFTVSKNGTWQFGKIAVHSKYEVLQNCSAQLWMCVSFLVKGKSERIERKLNHKDPALLFCYLCKILVTFHLIRFWKVIYTKTFRYCSCLTILVKIIFTVHCVYVRSDTMKSKLLGIQIWWYQTFLLT